MIGKTKLTSTRSRCYLVLMILLLILFSAVSADAKKLIKSKGLSINTDSVINFSGTHFDSWAFFSDRHFRSWANFSDAQFNSPAIFTSAHFDSVADFSYAHFNSWAYFYGAEFNSRANLSHTDFDSLAYFSHTHFYLFADFFRSQFYSWADFSDAHFDILADFSGASFKAFAYFYNARFMVLADFSNAHFDTAANFRYAVFDSVADFTNVHFAALVDFQYAHFKKKIALRNLSVYPKFRFDFNNTVLPDTIDLSNNPVLSVELLSTIDFTLADSLDGEIKPTRTGFWKASVNLVKQYFYPNDPCFGPKKIHWINFYNTDISRIKIDYSHFRLYFKDVDEQDKLHKELSYDIKESIYEQLLKNFKDRGQDDSYERLDIDYRWFKGRNAVLITGINDWWWRFGYEKWRIFIHSFLVIIFFSVVNFFLMHKLNDKNRGVYHMELIPEFLPLNVSKNTTYRLLRRLWFSIIYTSSIFFLLTFKIDKIRFAKLISLWIMFIYTIGLVCMGFIANLILQK